jgi:hypothetical protein
VSFFAPLFLIGLLGIALPLWLHRMNYSNPETRPFTATFLLKHAELTAATEHRLRYLLLLAARILALLFVVLLFAQPAWQRMTAPLAGDEAGSVFLVVDTSLSMRADNNFEEAIELAEGELDQLVPGQQIQLYSMGERLSSLTGLSNNVDEARRTLRQLRPGTGSMDYGTAMQQLDAQLRSVPGGRKVVLVSDMQSSNLPTRFAQLIPAAATELQLVSVTSDEENARVTASWNDNNLYINVEGDRPAGELAMQLDINGERFADLSMPTAQSQLEVDLSSARLLPGGNAVAIELMAGDSLAEDNRYFVAVDRSVRQRVLVLANQPDLQDALFVETALEAIASEGVDVRTVHAANRSSYEIANYDLLVTNDLGALASNLIADLENFLQDGGKVIAALGSQSLTGSTVPITDHEITRNNLSSTTTSRQYLVSSATTHPLLDGINFSGSINVFRWAGISLTSSDRLLARLSDGDPWAVERDIGDGTLLLFTTPLDSSWSNLPLSPAFVPLLTNAVNWLSQSFVAPEGLRTGSTLLAGRSQDTAITIPIQQILGPDGSPMLGISQMNQANVIQLAEAGVYQLQSSGSSAFVAVNTPAEESNLTPVSAANMDRWNSLANSVNNQQLASIRASADDSQWQSFEKWLLPLLLLVILLESIAANAYLWVRRQVTE